jgi:hypothetical protein
MSLRSSRVPAWHVIAVLGGLLLSLLCAAPAIAAEAPATPFWQLEARPAPTNLPPGGEGLLTVNATNLGDAEVNGGKSIVTITDTLPPGLKATGAALGFNTKEGGELGIRRFAAKCPVSSGQNVECTYTGHLRPYELLIMQIPVKVEASGPTTLENSVTVKGGEAAEASLTTPLPVTGEGFGFGVEKYEFTPENEKFETDSQTGSHPFQLTTTFNLNQNYEEIVKFPLTFAPTAPAPERNLNFRLPPGLIGNVNAVAQCTGAAFGAQGAQFTNSCPNNTVVGVAAVNFTDPGNPSELHSTFVAPVFNLVPAPGEPARFGISILHVPIVLDTSVRTGEDYGVTVSVHDASEAVQVLGSKVTFWGIPYDKRHNQSRGWACFGFGDSTYQAAHPCESAFSVPQPPPLLLMPTKCGPLETSMDGEAWNRTELEREGKPSTLSAGSKSSLPLSGCGELPFAPSIEVSPDTQSASTPTGMSVKVNVPQNTTLESSYEGKAEADVRSTRLELPVGLQASPAAATGLSTCSVGQAGFNGANNDTGSSLQGELETQGFTPAAASCPDSAKIGTVNIETPVLKEPVTGAVYLAQQNTNPFASPLVLYIIAEEPTSKVLVKLAGEVQINGETGQLTSLFKNTPQSPFEHLTLHLNGGDRASQATPAFCGEYTAKATFTTWSETVEGEHPTTAESKFNITSGPNGSGCPGSTLPFGPGFNAGTTKKAAGAYSPFTLTINKPDGQQALESITTQLPAGLAAKIAAVTPCPASAVESLPTLSQSAPSCGPESEIGTTTTSSGLGGKPVTLGGKLYLTGPVDGAPFGLLAVTHAEAGPFNLGWVSVLSTITINETTAAVTTKTVKPVPKILDGVPVQLKQINVSVSRPEFEFNPTNCAAASVGGTLTGWEGASSLVSYPSVTENCAALPFKPAFTASTSALTSKTNGASLKVKIAYPPGQYANVAKVETALPLALPSRLDTIQKACRDTTFESSPSHCGEGSEIGNAIARTPILKNPLVGTAYLVSHGGRAFPDLEIVLKGENGIKIVLDGQTDIKKGITKTTFAAVPDSPVESFELNLPEGPHSALGTSVGTNLCAPTTTALKTEHLTRRVKGHVVHYTKQVTVTVPEALVIPTKITGQNGAVINQTTPIVVSGCAAVKGFKAKALTRAQKLAKALKACKKKPKSKRAACEKAARKAYGPIKKTTKKK